MLNGHFLYTVDIALLSIGFFGILTSANLYKKLLSLTIMQTSVIIMYILIGYRGFESISPVLRTGSNIYVNPLPQVLMLTAIVVGLSCTAIGLAMIIKINKNMGSINNRVIDQKCHYDIKYNNAIIDLYSYDKNEENQTEFETKKQVKSKKTSKVKSKTSSKKISHNKSRNI